MVPPTSFNSSSLVRLLSSVGPRGEASAASAPVNLAESLSRWLGWADAIELSAALAAPPQAPALRAAPGASIATAQKQAAALSLACEQAARALAHTITSDVQSLGSQADDTARRSLSQALQRTMETRIGALRARARAAVAALSPAAGRLAALDAVLERALAGRERQLLASVPQLLAPNSTANDTLRQALLAELETRLQPLQGLLATLAENTAAETAAAAAAAPSKHSHPMNTPAP